MDRFASGMTARGPTLGPDRETWTGSMHVVSLPSVESVHAFVTDEPYHVAGRFESHRTWRFMNLLNGTMWDHLGPSDEPRFLVLTPDSPDLPRDRVIVHGGLHPLGDGPSGFVMAVQLPDRSLLDALPGAEVHDWEPGGRR